MIFFSRSVLRPAGLAKSLGLSDIPCPSTLLFRITLPVTGIGAVGIGFSAGRGPGVTPVVGIGFPVGRRPGIAPGIGIRLPSGRGSGIATIRGGLAEPAACRRCHYPSTGRPLVTIVDPAAPLLQGAGGLQARDHLLRQGLADIPLDPPKLVELPEGHERNGDA